MIFMRWGAIVLLLSDGRVRFLTGFIILAIILAIVLIFFEFSLKKKKMLRAKRFLDYVPIDNMRKFLEENRTPKEKMDFINKTAKEYFGKTYGISVDASYSLLIERFGKDNMNNEVVFCKEMFDRYYSDKELTDARVAMLGDLFIDIFNKDKKSVEVLDIPSFSQRAVGPGEDYCNIVDKKESLGWVSKISKGSVIKKVGTKSSDKLYKKIEEKKKRALILAKIREEELAAREKKDKLERNRAIEDRLNKIKFEKKNIENSKIKANGVASRIVMDAKNHFV